MLLQIQTHLQRTRAQSKLSNGNNNNNSNKNNTPKCSWLRFGCVFDDLLIPLEDIYRVTIWPRDSDSDSARTLYKCIY